MRVAAKDLTRLWRPGAVLLAALILAWALLSYTRQTVGRAQDRLTAQTQALQEARQRFQRSDEEKASILHYLPAYRVLEQQGFVGAENRLEWLEGLRAADRKAGLDGVQFRIDPQERFEHPAATATIAGRMRRSTMRLNLGLTHEGDLLEFLDALQQHSQGLFLLRTCVVNGEAGDPAPRRANLRAECEIDWLTVAPQESKT